MPAPEPDSRIRRTRRAPRPHRSPRLPLAVLALLASLTLPAPACRDAAVRQRDSILLVTLDTTRADALSCTGAPPGLTPHLDRLADEGVLYEQARTVAPLTLPAHASMLTGLYPLRHGVRDNSVQGLAGGAHTLAEHARDAGYDTAAFVAAAVLGSDFGLAQGFDVYDEPRAAGGPLEQHYDERPAGDVADAAIAWLETRETDRPFLLWVHFFDPHAPYAPPPELLERAGGNRYLGEVAAMDRALGRLLEHLGDPKLERTLVLVAGDHGEGLDPEREMTHGVFCYGATMRVPWILRYPDGHRAGERSDELVSVVDVHPTLLAAMGVAPPPGIDGESLLRRRVDPTRGVYVESCYGYLNHGWSPIAGWIGRRGKYLHTSDPQLFDLAADPAERRPLDPSARPGFVQRARAALAELAERPRLSGASVDPAMLERLRRLGYAADPGAAEIPGPLEPTNLPPPRTRTRELGRYQAALARGSEGDVDRAIELLRSVVEENPRNAAAWNQLAGFLLASGRRAEAREALEARLELGPGRSTTHFNLGSCFEIEGELEEARLHYERALELEPSRPDYRAALERVRQALE